MRPISTGLIRSVTTEFVVNRVLILPIFPSSLRVLVLRALRFDVARARIESFVRIYGSALRIERGVTVCRGSVIFADALVSIGQCSVLGHRSVLDTRRHDLQASGFSSPITVPANTIVPSDSLIGGDGNYSGVDVNALINFEF